MTISVFDKNSVADSYLPGGLLPPYLIAFRLEYNPVGGAFSRQAVMDYPAGPKESCCEDSLNISVMVWPVQILTDILWTVGRFHRNRVSHNLKQPNRNSSDKLRRSFKSDITRCRLADFCRKCRRLPEVQTFADARPDNLAVFITSSNRGDHRVSVNLYCNAHRLEYCIPISSTALQLSAFARLSSQGFASSVHQLRKFQAARFETQIMTNTLATYTFAPRKDKNPPPLEFPSEMVTIKILCHGVDVNPLKRIPDLQDFEIERDRNNPNIIVFKGIYPDNDFNNNNILREVQQYDGNARIA